MAIGQDTQVQDGHVALAIAVRAATPLVIADAVHRVQQRLVSRIIARENRLARLAASLPLTQPVIGWMREPVQHRWKIEEWLPPPDMVDGVRGMSEPIH